jgi:hypothetical protein
VFLFLRGFGLLETRKWIIEDSERLGATLNNLAIFGNIGLLIIDDTVGNLIIGQHFQEL